MSAHTPGPWTVSTGEGKKVLVMADRYIVARCCWHCPPHDGAEDSIAANAHLIAAAPELASRLRKLVALVQCDWLTPNSDSEEELEEIERTLDQARALLDRIDGGTL